MRTLEAAARRLKPPRGPDGGGGRGRRLPRLVLVSDPVRLPDPRAAAARLPPGRAAVLARGLGPGLLASLAALARQRRLLLLVAGDGRAALRHRGAGLHLPDRPGTPPGLLPFLLARRHRWRPHLALTVAAHGRAGLARGRRLGADAAMLSPVFPTRSHPGAPALGPCRWAALARRAGRPVLALGGLRPGNAGRLPVWAGGVAAIGALLGPPPPAV